MYQGKMHVSFHAYYAQIFTPETNRCHSQQRKFFFLQIEIPTKKSLNYIHYVQESIRNFSTSYTAFKLGNDMHGEADMWKDTTKFFRIYSLIPLFFCCFSILAKCKKETIALR